MTAIATVIPITTYVPFGSGVSLMVVEGRNRLVVVEQIPGIPRK